MGDHTVLFFGDGECIEVRHQAHSRQAFAGGAVRVAHWVMEQGGPGCTVRLVCFCGGGLDNLIQENDKECK